MKIENVIDLRNGHQQTPEGVFVVEVEANLRGLQNETNFQCYEAKMKIIGVFEKSGEPALSDDVFVKVNAPAIIFPFVREHFATLALKAAIGNVLLPPLNFTRQ
ncbi:MAG TPA: protein-export chaperone SecB [Puia sp.]|nr:protein-export chaperone SecB [Puia sp.]